MQNSYYDSDLTLGPFQNSFSEKTIRLAFIRKVYGILLVQLAITVAMIALFVFEEHVKNFSHANPAMFWAAFAMTIVLIFVLACCQNVRRSFPANFICLFMFTILEGILLGSAASYYDAEAVILAVGICAIVSLGLSIFACQTKYDFTTCGGALLVCLLIFVCFGFFCIFIPGKITEIIYASLGALIFSMYLVFDTQMMIGGRYRYSLSPEEYIFAALNIYLDIINLFLYILSLVAGARD